jgi:uncharacterized protein YggE
MQKLNKNLVGLLAGLLLPAICNAAPELKGSPDELRNFLVQPAPTVSITGRAKESAFSDVAKITLVVTTEGAKLAAALTRNSELRGAITQDFVAAGIPADKITNSKFSTSPQFGWFGDKPKSFEVVNRVLIEVAEEAQLNVVAAAADGSPQIEFAGIEFEHSKKKATEAAVLKKAVDDATRQQQFYEAQLGLQLVPVAFYAQDVRPVPRRAVQAAALEEVVVSARKRSESYQDVPVAVVSFDEVEYKAAVTVTFEISQAKQ